MVTYSWYYCRSFNKGTVGLVVKNKSEVLFILVGLRTIFFQSKVITDF